MAQYGRGFLHTQGHSLGEEVPESMVRGPLVRPKENKGNLGKCGHGQRRAFRQGCRGEASG
jgi:hypothetical protein